MYPTSIPGALAQFSTPSLQEIEIIRYADGIERLQDLLARIEAPLRLWGFPGLKKIKLAVVPNNRETASVLEVQRNFNNGRDANVDHLMKDLREGLGSLWNDVCYRDSQGWCP